MPHLQRFALLAALMLALGACSSDESDDTHDHGSHDHDSGQAHDGHAHDAGDYTPDERTAKPSQNATFFVSYTSDPSPIPFNELFTMTVTVADPAAPETPLTDVDSVSVEARMPAHGHGMNTEPVVTKNDDGTFLVEGLKFHMQSSTPAERWEVAADITRGDATDQVVFEVVCCEE